MTALESNTELYRRHAVELTRYATVLVGPHDAPDVVADAVIAAFGSPGWSQVTNHRAYLYRAVLTTAVSRHRSADRRQRRETAVATSVARTAEAASADAATTETGQAIDANRMLATLPPHQRAVVFLTYWADQSIAQVASTLDISEGSVRKQLARARQQLRKVLSND